MYNIIRLREEFKDKPKKYELLNIIHQQIEDSNYADCITISLDPAKKYSSRIKKNVIHRLGYKETRRRLSNKFEIKRRWY